MASASDLRTLWTPHVAPAMPDRLTHECVQFAATLTYADLPPAVVTAAKRCLVDGIGVAIAGTETDVAARLRSTPRDAGPCRFFGAPESKGSLSQAALYLGACGNALDWDDVQLPEGPSRPFGLLMHATVPLLATILPLAEWRVAEGGDAVSGEELLTAFVAGWEVAGKLAVAINPNHYFSGFHTSGTLGTFGCAIAAAKVLDLSPTHMTWALGHAAAMAAGVRASLGTMTKPLHVGWCAARGIEAALLARAGVDASDEALDGPYGYLTVAGPGADVDLVSGRFGAPFILESPGVSAKPFPCGAVTHPGMDALRRAMAEHALKAEEISKITVSAGSNVWGPISFPLASTSFEARYCFPFLLAAMALRGTAGRAEFDEAFVTSPDCAAFQRKVTLHHDKALDDLPTDVVQTQLDIETTDGRSVSVEARADYPGGPSRPLDDSEVDAKFADAVAGLLSPDNASEIHAMLRAVERLSDVRDLLDAVGPVTVASTSGQE